MDYLDTYWDNLIFTKDTNGFSLRGHHKDLKKSKSPAGWFHMTILASNCTCRTEAVSKAIVYTKELLVCT